MRLYTLLVILLAIIISANIPAVAQDDNELRESKSFTVLVEGDGTDVVLIPGLATPRDVWKPLRAQLSKTHRVHSVQIRGFGDDPQSNGEADALLDKIVFELADYIDDEITAEWRSAPPIIGHSLGGLSAMMIAARHPSAVSKIMVVDSLPFFGLLFGPTITAKTMKPQAEFLRNSIAAQPKGQVDERGLLVQSNSAHGREQVKNWSKTADPKVMAQLFYEVATTDIRSELPSIKAPVMMLYPIDETVMPSSRTKAIYENAYSNANSATLVPIMNSRHFIMLDKREVFEEIVLQFLDISE